MAPPDQLRRMKDNPEVISSLVGLLRTNALVFVHPIPLAW
jgi:hypothetical protein